VKKLALFTFICLHGRLAALPLWFEPNGAHFQARHLLLSPTQVVIQAGESQVMLTLRHANPHARGEPLDRLPGISNYYFGNDPKKWRTDVPHFARVRYHDVYPGIDVIYYGNAEGKLEYDFVVRSGANPHQIQIALNKPVHTTSDGDLLVAGLRQHRPKVYQHGHEIACDYIVNHEHRVQLALATYDHAESLTIDPVIEYATYLGGNGYDVATATTVDATGAAYVTGYLQSPNYPSLDPFQQTSGLGQDIVVAKFTPSGNGLVWYTWVGGSALNTGAAISLDTSGNAYVGGWTASNDFPVKNAAQPVFGGGYENAVIFKLSPLGKLVYSTYLGGNNQERAESIAIDSTGAAFITGFTWSIDFPIKNALQKTISGRPDAFVAKLAPTGDHFLFATYLGGSGPDYGEGLALDSDGNPVIVGGTSSPDFPVKGALQTSLGGRGGYPGNGFITKISAAGDRLISSTFIGESGNGGLASIAIDTAGQAYVFGAAFTTGWPLKNPIQNAYAGGQSDLYFAKLPATLDSLVFASYLGGSDLDFIGGLALDKYGNAYITGCTYSTDLPLKDSLQPFRAGIGSSNANALIVKTSPEGSLVYSTLVGGQGGSCGRGIAVDVQSKVYVAGVTTSEDFPVKNPLQSTFGGGPGDMFLLRLAPDSAPASPFMVTPATLLFRYVAGGSLPAPQTVLIASSTASVFAPTSSATWLKFTASGTTTPATLSVSADPTSLQQGVYTGAIQIDPQTSVQVNLTVLAPGPVVTGISPAVIALGSEATTVKITGTGFQPGATVQLTGGVALATKFIDSGTLQITLDKPTLAQQVTLSFVVVNPNSVPSNTVTLTIGTPTPTFTAASVANAASFTGGPVAPGEIISIFGTSLSGSVTFDGTPATLVFSSPAQVNVTVPYSVAGPTSILQMGETLVQLQVAQSAPGIFAAVSAGDNIVVLYATGCGALTNDDLPRCALPVSATVNDEAAQVLYAGIAPGLVQGANQINIQLPDDITTGQVTIVLTAGDASSKPFNFTLP
jgi:uncharacterized protein (TIGR03437 family)